MDMRWKLTKWLINTKRTKKKMLLISGGDGGIPDHQWSSSGVPNEKSKKTKNKTNRQASIERQRYIGIALYSDYLQRHER